MRSTRPATRARPSAEIAERLGAALELVEAVLAIIQTFDPPGIGARDLAECLACSCGADRFDPAMQALLDNLDLLARRDFAALAARSAASTTRTSPTWSPRSARLDPKPGRAFGGGADPGRWCPTCSCGAAPDGSWHVELNPDTLPRVLVNQSYYAQRLAHGQERRARRPSSPMPADRQLADRSLDQRAKTILKVAAEIVRQQDGFLLHGVAHLRPLNLKTVADAIGMHESTVSRVTSNKYIGTPPRHLRDEVFLHRRHRRRRGRRGALVRGRAPPHQAADRRRSAPTTCFRRRARADAARATASTSPAARWPSTASPCASRHRSSAGGRSRPALSGKARAGPGAPVRLRPGHDSVASILPMAGVPKVAWRRPDGTALWCRGPLGPRCGAARVAGPPLLIPYRRRPLLARKTCDPCHARLEFLGP